MTLLAVLAVKAIMNDGRRKRRPQPDDEDETAHEPVPARDEHGQPDVSDEQTRSERKDETDLGPHQLAHIRSLRRGLLRRRRSRADDQA
ncbi:MAG: hypothetical protein ACXV3V_05140 [Actinomycetes bacterium]